MTRGAIIICVLAPATEVIVDQDNENSLWLSPLTNVNLPLTGVLSVYLANIDCALYSMKLTIDTANLLMIFSLIRGDASIHPDLRPRSKSQV